MNVHTVGGNKDLALHLKGLTMRVNVLQELIEILRKIGYPGYEQDGVNSPGRVAQRLEERYTQKYGTAVFTSTAVTEAIESSRNKRPLSCRTRWPRRQAVGPPTGRDS